MKKIAVIVTLSGIAFVAGFVVRDQPWKRRWICPPQVMVPEKPVEVIHFGITKPPEFSSDHYYFRCGFTDVDEYWSFCLPPEQAEAFLAAYAQSAELSLTADTSDIPQCVRRAEGYDEWDDRYWFGSLEELDRVYYRRLLFCGYSASRNRLYCIFSSASVGMGFEWDCLGRWALAS